MLSSSIAGAATAVAGNHAMTTAYMRQIKEQARHGQTQMQARK